MNAILPSCSNELVHPSVCEKIPKITALQIDDSTPLLESKPEPFYISLFINGHMLNNCIIDLGAFDNIMPSTLAKALGLSLNKTFDRCYSMDSKQIPLLGQIKDAQVVLASHPNKRIMLTILIDDIPASYGMLLSHTFCRDLGGEIKMDWSQATIPIGKQ